MDSKTFPKPTKMEISCYDGEIEGGLAYSSNFFHTTKKEWTK